MKYILAIDQGTTSSRAIVFDGDLRTSARAQQEFTQIFPKSGWVEHDAEEIWSVTKRMCVSALERAGTTPAEIGALGIANQRETVVLWEKSTGRPIYNAIVWQDRRTADLCAQLRSEGMEPEVQKRTGLLLDPYFSASKIAWILDTVPNCRTRAEAGDILFGTIDTWLIWKLTEGAVHATDATNASRTMLYNIRTGIWDDEMLALFNIPPALLPEVKDSGSDFGTATALGGNIPITAALGDQHAATVGQACFSKGMLKSTYGTGCFAVMNTGPDIVTSHNRLLTTLAYQIDGRPTYALEGSIFVAGAVVQWLRDGLKIISSAEDTMSLARAADQSQRVIVVPAFTGLGAPYWDPDARAAIFGLTRNSGPEELARAALESVGFQTRDLLEAMWGDMGQTAATLRVDGGFVANDWAMQFLSDILGASVDRPVQTETTALGAAWLAGYQSGLAPDAETFSKDWSVEQQFEPGMDDATRQAAYDAWKKAVAATRSVSGNLF
ncbi:MAG: glycerol kinase GlpK [Pseudomonadota bacterium]